jgi:thioredoxin-dependent peroxiredoxin
MKKSLSLFIAAGLLAAVSIAARAADDAAAMPAEGQKAPGFTLPSQDGSPISLDQYHGKWVVLYFYPKDMTTGCTIEAHKFQDALPQLEAKNAVVLGVSVDNLDSHKQFCAKDGLTFHLLSDTDHKVVGEYGSLADHNGMVMANRNTFLIDPKGNIAKVWTKVNPTNAASDVLAVLP